MGGGTIDGNFCTLIISQDDIIIRKTLIFYLLMVTRGVLAHSYHFLIALNDLL